MGSCNGQSKPLFSVLYLFIPFFVLLLSLSLSYCVDDAILLLRFFFFTFGGPVQLLIVAVVRYRKHILLIVEANWANLLKKKKKNEV